MARSPKKPPGIVSLTSTEVMDLTGIKFRTLDYWARNGVVTPSIQPGDSRGKIRLYSEKDVQLIRLALELRKLGLVLRAVRPQLDYYRDRPIPSGTVAVTLHVNLSDITPENLAPDPSLDSQAGPTNPRSCTFP